MINKIVKMAVVVIYCVLTAYAAFNNNKDLLILLNLGMMIFSGILYYESDKALRDIKKLHEKKKLSEEKL